MKGIEIVTIKEEQPFQDVVAARIKEMRKRAGLTQEEFAESLGVTRGAVGNWERGCGITFANLRTIAAQFEKEPSYFIDEGRGPFQDTESADTVHASFQQSAIELAKRITGHTGDALAKELGISAAHLSRMANNKRRAGAELIAKLAAVSGKSTEEFCRLLGATVGSEKSIASARNDDVSRFIEEAFLSCERLRLVPTAETVSSLVKCYQFARQLNRQA